jgi:hypothetical protein
MEIWLTFSGTHSGVNHRLISAFAGSIGKARAIDCGSTANFSQFASLNN